MVLTRRRRRRKRPMPPAHAPAFGRRRRTKRPKIGLLSVRRKKRKR